jgi:hypothetical protein
MQTRGSAAATHEEARQKPDTFLGEALRWEWRDGVVEVILDPRRLMKSAFRCCEIWNDLPQRFPSSLTSACIFSAPGPEALALVPI